MAWFVKGSPYAELCDSFFKFCERAQEGHEIREALPLQGPQVAGSRFLKSP